MKLSDFSNQEIQNMAYAYVKQTFNSLKEYVESARPFDSDCYKRIQYLFEEYERAVKFEKTKPTKECS